MIPPEWLFGYGSVIYRPKFPFVERRAATLRGFQRLSQASDDHRGTKDAPGRVVTLREQPSGTVRGVAFRIDAAVAAEVFAELDVREKAGYVPQRLDIEIEQEGGVTRPAPEGRSGIEAPSPRIEANRTSSARRCRPRERGWSPAAGRRRATASVRSPAW